MAMDLKPGNLDLSRSSPRSSAGGSSRVYLGSAGCTDAAGHPCRYLAQGKAGCWLLLQPQSGTGSRQCRDTRTQVLLWPSSPAVSTPAVRSYLAGYSTNGYSNRDQQWHWYKCRVLRCWSLKLCSEHPARGTKRNPRMRCRGCRKSVRL